MTTVAWFAIAKHVEEAAAFLTSNSSCLPAMQQWTVVVNAAARFGGYGMLADRLIAGCVCDVVVLTHADVVLQPETLGTWAAEAMKDQIVGLVGRRLDGHYVWGKEGGGPVSTLDGCAVAFRRGLYGEVASAGPDLHPVRFNTVDFDNFHCCVEDLCLQFAQRKGLPIVVPAAPGIHLEQRENPPDWLSNYWQYRARLSALWPNVPFATT